MSAHMQIFNGAKWIALLLILSLLAGCSIARVRQEFIGLSINDVKTSKNKQIQSFEMSSSECINKIKDALSEMKAIVREDKKKQFITADNLQKAFRSAIDTTQVGILVTSTKPNRCEAAIASGNIDLAVFVSKELAKKLKPQPQDQRENKEKAV